MAAVFASAADSGSGVVICTTRDSGSDELAIAIPFVKAEQFELVTNVTTPDGNSIRVTNNRLKEIVRPPDLSRATVADEAGLQSLKARAQSLRALQKRYPRASDALDAFASEMERAVKVIESGNVLYEGRVLPRAEYETLLAASRGKSIDITLNGRAYTKARLSSIADETVSVTHDGGVVSIPLPSLSDEQIARLNETATGHLIEKPKEAAPVIPEAPPVSHTQPPSLAAATPVPPEEPAQTAIFAPVAEVATPPPPKRPIALSRLRTLLRESQSQVETLRVGHAAFADIQTFPSGRYGPMKYDEAMREVTSQKAVAEAAFSERGSLKQNLRVIGGSSPEDERVPAPLRERLFHLAELKEDFVEEFTAIHWLDSELSAILSELESVAPEKNTAGSRVLIVPDSAATPGAAPVRVTASPSATRWQDLTPLAFLLAGVLALAATGGSVLLQNHRRKILDSSCPRCRQYISEAADSFGQLVSCPVCLHTFTAPDFTPESRRRRAQSPGSFVYGGVAVGTLLLLVGVFLQVRHSTATPADRSRYTVMDYPADLHGVRRDAEAGNPEAQYSLALFHDGAPDPAEAAIWYVAAANSGGAFMEYAAGLFFAMGAAEMRNPELAEYWLNRSAEQDFMEAQMALGLLYRGQYDLPYKPEESVRWYTRAAELGSGEAMYHLGVAYGRGVDVPPDLEAGRRWFAKSVEAGFGPAVEIFKFQGERIEAQKQAQWRQIEETLPPFQGGSPFSVPSPTNYIPPNFEEGRRRAEELRQSRSPSQQGYR